MASEPLSSRRVLISNPDQAEQHHLSSVVTSLGFEPVVVGSVHEPLAPLSQNGFLLSLIDLDAMGTAQLRRLKAEGGDPGHVIIIADAGGPTRVPEPDVLGSHDVLKRPLTPERLKQAIKTAIARPAHTAGAETQDDGSRRLGDELSLWTSSLMLEIREIIRQAARADITVLIFGETGTGKDLVARGHPPVRRRGRPAPSSRSTAPPCPGSFWRASSSVTSAGLSPELISSRSASSNRPITAPSFSTRSEICIRPSRESSSTCSRTASSPASAAGPPSRSTCGSSPRPTRTSSRPSRLAGSATTSTTG